MGTLTAAHSFANPVPEMGPLTQGMIDTLKDLMVLLATSDLTALERFADVRSQLQRPQSALDDIENALQDLDLDSALKVCQRLEH